MNSFILRCSLIFVKLTYHLLPVISFLLKVILALLIIFVTILLFLIIF